MTQEFIRISLTPRARDILRFSGKKFTEESGRKVSFSETVERLARLAFSKKDES